MSVSSSTLHLVITLESIPYALPQLVFVPLVIASRYRRTLLWTVSVGKLENAPRQRCDFSLSTLARIVRRDM